MFAWFSRLLIGRHEIEPVVLSGEYWIYTTEFDQIVHADDFLPSTPLSTSPAAEVFAKAKLEDHEKRLKRVEEDLKQTMSDLEKLLASSGSAENRSGNSEPIILLIDHSGSMRGHRAKLVFLLANMFSKLCFARSRPFEVLGFTTVDWKGGNPRKNWIKNGRPHNPGRLCALRHIIYSRFEDDNLPDMSPILIPSLLKENVDGEALLWAANRILEGYPNGGDIVVVSDGAPVDDSTYEANSDAFMADHLQDVIETFNESNNLRVHGIGIDCDVNRFYPSRCRLDSVSCLSSVAVPFLENILTGNR